MFWQAGFYMRIHKRAFEPLVVNNLVILAGKEGVVRIRGKADLKRVVFVPYWKI